LQELAKPQQSYAPLKNSSDKKLKVKLFIWNSELFMAFYVIRLCSAIINSAIPTSLLCAAARAKKWQTPRTSADIL
jgi:hypothetical protein